MESQKIRISIVNYTNTIPFVWGLKNSGIIGKIDLQEDIPSICARKLISDEVDIALLPVAVIPELSVSHIISRYCIGASGSVDSVRMYSDLPPDRIKRVLLDYQSRTSIELIKIIFDRLWKKEVIFEHSKPGFENKIGGQTAGVVIGDRTFAMKGKHLYEIDLASAWKELSGLPFVFAAWVSKKAFSYSFVHEFDEALEYGLRSIPRAVQEMSSAKGLSTEETIEYLRNKISYELDKEKMRGMQLFLEYLKENVITPAIAGRD